MSREPSPRCRPAGALVRACAALLLGALPACAAGAESAPRRHEVAIRAFTYHPAELVAAVGDTVVWVNEDIVPHTATSRAGGWDTGSLEAGGRRALQVTQRGEQPYDCTFHPGMQGRLVVR